jgi:putative NADH-flavin reductase
MRGDVMKVFVAGATGALGRQLVPRLVERGHDVVARAKAELGWQPSHPSWRTALAREAA